MLAYRAAAIAAVMFLGGSVAAAPQAENCHAIADPARRLACYDARDNGAATTPESAPAEQAGPEARARSEPAPMRVAPPAAAADANRTFDSRIVAASLLRNGLYHLRLADGSEWATTVTGQRPKIGEAIHHRRTFIGTHYFDTEDGRPLTVRPER